MTSKDTSKRFSFQTVILSIVVVIVLCATAWWIYQRSTHVYTDDARVASDMILISTKVLGLIEQLPVREGDMLTKGDLILQLDAEQAALRLSELQAQLKSTELAVAGRNCYG